MNKSFTKKIALTLLLASLPIVASANCPLGSKEPKFNCSSFEITIPLNITNTVGGPSFTVMDGNVGIGTLSPLASLDVQSSGTNATDTQLILRNPNADSNSTVSINSYSANEWRGSQYHIKNGQGTIFGISTADSSGSPTERLRITEDGKVGIKTNTPGSELHVNGTIRAENICDQDGNNCKTISSGWGGGGGGSGSGTVTSIGTGTGLLGGPITNTGTISVDVGTTANKIVQLNNLGQLPAVSAINLTNVNATNIGGAPISTGGTTNGQILGFNGTQWTNKSLAINDIGGLTTAIGSKLDAANMPASCSSNQTLTFTSPTGMWACSDITVTPAVFGSQSQNLVLAAPTNGSGNPEFRALTAADLPPISGSKWTESSGNIYRETGSVGIGTASINVSSALEVASTTQGFLPPRMTTAQRDAISSPTPGLMIFNTSNSNLQYFNGISWMNSSATSNGNSYKKAVQLLPVTVANAVAGYPLSTTVNSSGVYLILANGMGKAKYPWAYFGLSCTLSAAGDDLDSKYFYYGSGQTGGDPSIPMTLFGVITLQANSTISVACTPDSNSATRQLVGWNILAVKLAIDSYPNIHEPDVQKLNNVNRDIEERLSRLESALSSKSKHE